MKLPPLPTIIIDTREQKPYEFSGQQTKRQGLQVGDYSLVGHESACVCERKSKEDAWGCVGGSRSRFRSCLQRLAGVTYPAIVIESDLRDFSVAPARSRLTAAHAVGSFISWSQEFRIPIFFCPNRAYAERVTLRWLLAYWRHLHAPRVGSVPLLR